MKKNPVVFFLFTLGLLINACTPSGIPVVDRPVALSDPSVENYFGPPQNGAIYPLGRAIELWAYERTTGVTVTSLAFLANGVSVGTGVLEADTNGRSYSSTWTPPAVGEYYLQSQVTLSDGTTSISEPNRICVLPIQLPGGGYGGYSGPCQIPTQIPNSPSTGDLTIFAVAAPSIILFSPVCPSNASVTFIADVNDPQDLVAFIYVIVALNSHGGNSSSFLNWTTTRPINQKEYRGTIEFYPSQLSGQNTLPWFLITYGRDGHELLRTSDVIGVQPLECSQQHLDISTATPEILEIVPPNPARQPKEGDGQPGESQPGPPPCLKACP